MIEVEVIQPDRTPGIVKHKGIYYHPGALPPSGDSHKWHKQLRWFVTECLPLVQDRRCAIDGGAHIGRWAKLLTRYFDVVHAFEPLPTNCDCIALNAPDATIWERALSNSEGRIPMTIKGSSFSTGDGTEKSLQSKPTYRTTTIDALCATPGLIKLDVEGLEPEALEGAVETIRLHRPVLFVEHKFRKQEIDEFMRREGYTLHSTRKPDTIWLPT